MDITELNDLVIKRNKLGRHIEELKIEETILERKIKDICPHPTTITTYEYDEGGYLDRASTTTINKCSICGKILGTKTETHNYYG